MPEILLVIKIVGIVLSSATLIGNQRLITLERRIREFVSWRNLAGIPALFYDSQGNFITSFGGGCLFYFSRYLVLAGVPIIFVWLRWDETIRFVRSMSYFSFDHVKHILFWGIMVYLWLVISEPLWLLSLAVMYTILLIIIGIAYFLSILASGVLWFITRPYAWLDSFVQRKKLESTLFALGIIVAIIGEVVDRYYFP